MLLWKFRSRLPFVQTLGTHRAQAHSAAGKARDQVLFRQYKDVSECHPHHPDAISETISGLCRRGWPPVFSCHVTEEELKERR